LKDEINAKKPTLRNAQGLELINSDVIGLWAKFCEVWTLMIADSSKVKIWENDDFRSQRITLSEFGKLWVNCYPSRYYPYYLHIIVCHTIYVWKKYKSLRLIENQGIESTHHYHELIAQAIGCNDGFNSSVLTDVLKFKAKSILYKDTELMETKFEPMCHKALQDWNEKTNATKNPRKKQKISK